MSKRILLVTSNYEKRPSSFVTVAASWSTSTRDAVSTRITGPTPSGCGSTAQAAQERLRWRASS